VFIWYERRHPDPMMDVSLFNDAAYALAIATICTVFFSIYGMLLLTTQLLQNVRGFTPEQTGLVILPFSLAVTVVSPLVGRVVGRFGARLPILAGLGALIAGLVVLVISGHSNTALVLLGLGLCGIGGALCLTPITTIAMTSVPPQRAGMASGIMSAQRAIGSTVGFAVLGSILAAWLNATLEADLAAVLPNPAERTQIARTIVQTANPRAHVAEIGPKQPITHPDAAIHQRIVAVADGDFISGIRAALLVAVALLAAVLAVGWKWYPRGGGMIAGARREATTLAASED
jgi:MFS family permease